MRLLMPALVSMLALSACTTGYGHHRGDPHYGGSEWRGLHPSAPRPHLGELSGPGVEILDEWLRETDEGKAILSLGWRDARRGEISEDIAHRANIWFRRYADRDRDMVLTDPEIRIALVAAAAPHLRLARDD